MANLQPTAFHCKFSVIFASLELRGGNPDGV